MLEYVSLIALSLPAIWIGHHVLSYLISLYQFQKFGASSPVPSITVYTPRDSFATWLLSPWVAPFFESLPPRLGHWFSFVKRDFSWWKKEDFPLPELGDLYWNVGPGGAQLWSSSADINAQILQRKNDFVKNIEDYYALNIYGVNVVSTEGAVWQRHRKITGPPFNEKNSSLVFEETLSQAKSMLASFTQNLDGSEADPGREPIVEDLARWTMTLTLNVISSASLAIKAVWPASSVASSTSNLVNDEERPTKPETEDGLPFQKSFDSVMTNVRILVALWSLPSLLLDYLPIKYFQEILKSSDDFLGYMHTLIGEHKAKIDAESDDDSAGSADLLSSIVRGSTGNKSASLSEEEMIGNIFIFVLAGHETTASTLQTALILLACEPEMQKEVRKEIGAIWDGKEEGEDLRYENYPKMRTIMALMLETLRLYPPVVQLPKFTITPQTVTHNSQTVDIPANSRVSIDVVSTHRSPKYWNQSPSQSRHTFAPSRWLMPSSYVQPPDTSNESPAHENLLCPKKGAFIAFSSGFRGCLGKKFAQVEFCVVVATLLRHYSVVLVGEKGESWEEAKRKALGALDDRRTGVAMRLNGKVKVRFVRSGK
ncbi:cytochrome P450 [Amylocarpus encephaloides]|uniref:Cytochrome P450 n=1 Tax=Amylocarpus encephaloides TaxID=45428 RepID=A0A9P8C013_9HELO|nr:cytochrome P450 [Amylocarpus encephaloides]